MAKYRNPFNSQELWISQTYHSTSSNKAVDFGNAPAGTPVYAVADGTIGTISSAYGSYLTQDVANSDHKLFYVHIYNFKVSRGQSVKRGQLLAEVAPQSVNGGYPPHLHLGLQTQYNLMDYMDRSIVFRTKYQAIKNIWFTGENLDWSKHKDLSFLNSTMFKKGDTIIFTGEQNIRQGSGTTFPVISVARTGDIGTIIDGPRTANNYTWYDIRFDKGGTGWVADVNKMEIFVKPPTPPEPPGQTECEKQVTILKQQIQALESTTEAQGVEITRLEDLNRTLTAEYNESKIDLRNLQIEYDALSINYNRVENEKNEAIKKLAECKEECQSNVIEKFVEWFRGVLTKILGDRS